MDEPPIFLESAAYAALVDLMRRGNLIAPWSVLIVFDGHRPPAVYSNASATGLIPVLGEVQARLEVGTLRMPMSRDGLRFVEEEGQTLGTMGVEDGSGEKEGGQ